MPTRKQSIDSDKAMSGSGLSREDVYCDDFSRELSLEERMKRNYSPNQSFLNESNSKTIGYTIKKGNDFKYFPLKSRGRKNYIPR